MTETTLISWALLGFVPYKLAWRVRRPASRRARLTIHIQALFWTLRIKRRGDRRLRVDLRVRLIEKLRDAVWAAIMKLRDS